MRIHPSHKTRVLFDASTYDDICIHCGATDAPGGGLDQPCPDAPKEEPVRTEVDRERLAFLDAIKANPEDQLVHDQFADWLAEHDEPEEADRYRVMPASVAWLKEFTRSINYNRYRPLSEPNEHDEVFDYDNPIGKEESDPHTYEYILQAGHYMARGEYAGFATDAGADFFRESQANREEFFQHWSIVTGVKVDQDVVDKPMVGCAC